MAKIGYIGSNSKAHQIRKMHVGINGKSRKIIKAYVGVDGKARLFFLSTKPTVLGVDWLECAMPQKNHWECLAYGAGKFVALPIAGNGAISTDGENWKEISMPIYSGWTAISYGAGKFVASSMDANSNVAYSVDGENWTAIKTDPNYIRWAQIAYGGGKFVAALGSNPSIMYSNDGIKWNDSYVYNHYVWCGVAYGANEFVMVGYSPDEETSTKYAYSPNGIDWTIKDLPIDSRWIQIKYVNGMFIALGTIPTRVICSLDGINWSVINMPITNMYWTDVAYGGGKFVAVSRESSDEYSDIAAYSEDGKTWKLSKLPKAGNWEAVEFGSGRFVAICGRLSDLDLPDLAAYSLTSSI